MVRFRWFAFLCVLVAVVSGCAAKAPAMKAAAGPDPSKNGPIAFVRYTDEAQTESNLFVMDADGRNERQLTKPVPKSNVDQPMWSPDGKHIVFARCSDPGGCHMWTIASNGTALTKLPSACTGHEPCEENSPTYSPDGRKIAYAFAHGPVDDKLGGQIKFAQLYVMNADGTNARAVTSFAAWSGDASMGCGHRMGDSCSLRAGRTELETRRIRRRCSSSTPTGAACGSSRLGRFKAAGFPPGRPPRTSSSSER